MATFRMLSLWFLLLGSIFILNRVSSETTEDPDDITTPEPINSNPISKFCPKVIPGVDRMTHGVDITKLNLFPENTVVDTGFRKMFVELTCTEGKQWSHPLIPGETFNWPDQIMGVDSVPAGSVKLSDVFTNDLQEYKNSILVTLDVDVTASFGALSLNVNYEKTQENLSVNNESIYEMAASVTSANCEFHSAKKIALSRDFTDNFQGSDSPKYEQNPERYDAFVQNYGTHYFESASFGGQLRLKTIVEQKYAQNTNKEDIKGHVKASFKEFFTLDLDVHITNEEERQHFRANTKTESSYFGGKGSIMPNSPTQPSNLALKQTKAHQFDDYMERTAVHESTKTYLEAGGDNFFSDWQPTVNRAPWLMSGRLKPIEDLISNEKFAKELTKAIKVHRLKAYIADLKRTIELKKVKLSEQRMKRIDSVEKAINSRQLSELEQMITTIDYIFLSLKSQDESISKEFQDDIIEGVLKLQIQLAQKCTNSERVDQLKVPLKKCVDQYEDYQKNKNNAAKREEFIQIAESNIVGLKEHVEGVCDHLLASGIPVYKWDECTECVKDEYRAISITRFPGLDQAVEHPKHP